MSLTWSCLRLVNHSSVFPHWYSHWLYDPLCLFTQHHSICLEAKPVYSFQCSALSPHPQIVRTFSFKGMTNKLFGQEAPEQREARLKLLEDLITEGEETVKEKTVERE